MGLDAEEELPALDLEELGRDPERFADRRRAPMAHADLVADRGVVVRQERLGRILRGSSISRIIQAAMRTPGPPAWVVAIAGVTTARRSPRRPGTIPAKGTALTEELYRRLTWSFTELACGAALQDRR